MMSEVEVQSSASGLVYIYKKTKAIRDMETRCTERVDA